MSEPIQPNQTGTPTPRARRLDARCSLAFVTTLLVALSGCSGAGDSTTPGTAMPGDSSAQIPGVGAPNGTIDPVTGNPAVTPTPSGGIGDPAATPGANPAVPSDTSATPGVAPSVGNPASPQPSSTTPVTDPPVAIDPSTADCTTPNAAFTPLRRLTAFEYGNTVFDLLGVAPTTQIPADGITDGYDNNSSVLTVSSLHAEKFVLASEEVAALAVANIGTLAPCAVMGSSETGEEACALDFARDFGRRAYRRDLTPTDEQFLMSAYAVGRDGGSYAEGIEVMIRAALQSPHFLYRMETAMAPSVGSVVSVGGFELANRLSYLIWASGPDTPLLDAAAAGQLTTPEQVAAAARTMLADPKARRGIADFYAQWLGTRKIDTTSKNLTRFPGYTDEVRAGMAAEMPAFIEYVLWQDDHKLSTLLTSPVAFANSALGAVYGVNVTSTEPQMVNLPDSQGRSGILTQAGFLSVQAHPDQTSPVLRGKFVRTKLMCQPPPPPPMDADITPPAVEEGATARERFSAHSESGSSCAGCHQLMDPIGFAFENFDAMGEFRTQENGRDIDASGEIIGGTDSLSGAFTGVRELAQKLATSDLVQDCVSTQWFRYAAGRNEAVGDECSIATLQNAFAASGGDLVELVVAMTQTNAFLYRSPTAQEVTQ